MTLEQIRTAKSIVEYAAINSLETEEIVLLGWAILEIDRLGTKLATARAELDRIHAMRIENDPDSVQSKP